MIFARVDLCLHLAYIRLDFRVLPLPIVGQ
jgi:hypothetical protein